MMVEVKTEKVYTITLTDEEIKALIDSLEELPKKAKAKATEATKKRYEIMGYLYDSICDAVENYE